MTVPLTIKKSSIMVPIDQLILSRFNPRTTRPDEDIDKLADRITRNGFEITRALWAYQNGTGYEVFAGGTRLEAVKRAGLNEVPVMLHEGLIDEDIVKLAEEDNENDEYHHPVSPVDEWSHYAWLYDQGWTQERIARAKGVSQVMVSYRLKLHIMPEEVKDFITQNLLDETHLREIMQLSLELYFSPWLTTEQAQLEIAQEASKYKMTVRQTKDLVNKWQMMIEAAQDAYQKLKEHQESYEGKNNIKWETQWCNRFISQLAEIEARTKVIINEAYSNQLNDYQQAVENHEMELMQQQNRVKAEQLRLKQEQDKQTRITTFLSKTVCGDATEANIPDKIALVLTDPPYGKNFQSKRRVIKPLADKIQNDDENALALLEKVLRKLHSKMLNNSTIFVWSSQEFEPEFRQAIKSAGFTWKGTYIWNKPNHGSGDLNGTFAPKHECIIHAVKGNPKLRIRPESVLAGKKFLPTDHPTPKPIDLLSVLIEAATDQNDLVVDPFFGSGSTLYAAHQIGRDFWGIEIEQKWYESFKDILFNLIAEVSDE